MTIEELLSHSVDGGLDADEAKLLEEALAQDPDLSTQVLFEESLIARIRDLEPEPVAPDFSQAILKEIQGTPAGSWTHRLGRFLEDILVPLTAAAAAVALVLIQFQPSQGPYGSPQAASLQILASLQIQKGRVRIGDQFHQAPTKLEVASGVLIQGDAKSEYALDIYSGVEMRPSSGARFSLEPRGVQLSQGSVRLDVIPGRGSFSVVTPHAVAKVLGTEFEVAANSTGTELKVHEGLVALATETSAVLCHANESAHVKAKLPDMVQKGPSPRATQEGPIEWEGMDPAHGIPSSVTSQLPSAMSEGVPDLDSNE